MWEVTLTKEVVFEKSSKYFLKNSLIFGTVTLLLAPVAWLMNQEGNPSNIFNNLHLKLVKKLFGSRSNIL